MVLCADTALETASVTEICSSEVIFSAVLKMVWIVRSTIPNCQCASPAVADSFTPFALNFLMMSSDTRAPSGSCLSTCGHPNVSSQSLSKARMISSVVAFLCLLAGILKSSETFTRRVASSAKTINFSFSVFVLYSLMSIPNTFQGVVDVDKVAIGNGSGRLCS